MCLFVRFLAKQLMNSGHWAKSKWTEMYFLFKCPADRNTSNTIKSFKKSSVLFVLVCLISREAIYPLCRSLSDSRNERWRIQPWAHTRVYVVFTSSGKFVWVFSVETVHAPSKSHNVNILCQTEHAPSLHSHPMCLVVWMKFIRYNQILQNIFCLICVNLFDFLRSDFSFMPVTERWLVSVVEPSRSEQCHTPKHYAQKHVRRRHVFKLFLLIL